MATNIPPWEKTWNPADNPDANVIDPWQRSWVWDERRDITPPPQPPQQQQPPESATPPVEAPLPRNVSPSGRVGTVTVQDVPQPLRPDQLRGSDRNSTETVVRSDLERQLRATPPRVLTQDELDQYVQMVANPNVSVPTIAAWLRQRENVFVDTPQARQAIETYRQELAAGRPVSSDVSYESVIEALQMVPESTDVRDPGLDPETSDSWSPESITGIKGLDAALERGAAYNPLRSFEAWWKDFTNESDNWSRDDLALLFPDLDEDALERIHDGVIGTERARELQSADYQVNIRSPHWGTQLAGDVIGGVTPADVFTFTRGTTILMRAAENVGSNIILDATLQAGDVAYGAQEGYRPSQTFMAAASGLILQGVLELGVAGVNRVIRASSGPEGGIELRMEDGSTRVLPYSALPEDTRLAIEQMQFDDFEGRPTTRVVDTNPEESFGAPYSPAEVGATVESVLGAFAERPAVTVLRDIEDIPDPNLRAGIIASLKEGEEFSGFYNRQTGEAVIFSSAIQDAAHMNSAILHEALGHYNLDREFGQGLNVLLDDLYDRSPTVREEIAPFLPENPTRDDIRIEVEELLARASEGGPISPSRMDQIVNWTRSFLRERLPEGMQERLGLEKLSDREIRVFLGSIHANMRDGGYFSVDRSAGGDGVRFMRLWHGSPHRFTKFDIQRIGTGEGAQVFGRGLYFTESQEIGLSYKESTTESWNRRYGDGVRLGNRDVVEMYHAQDLIRDRFLDSPEYDGYNPRGQSDASIDVLPYVRDNGTIPPLDWFVTRQIGDNWHWEGTRPTSSDSIRMTRDDNIVRSAERLHRFWQGIEREGLEVYPTKEGVLYEVEVPDDTVFMDWYGRMDEQSPEVRKVLEAMGFNPDIRRNLTGKDIYNQARRKFGGPQAASEALNRAGIQGIRYPANTVGKNAETLRRILEDPNHPKNYVLFTDDLIDVRDIRFMRNNRNKPSKLSTPSGKPSNAKQRGYAGNINLNRVQSKQAVDTMYLSIADEVDAPDIGPRTFEDINAEAKAIAARIGPMELVELEKVKPGGLTVPEQGAIRLHLIRAVERAKRLDEKMQKGTATELDVMNYRDAEFEALALFQANSRQAARNGLALAAQKIVAQSSPNAELRFMATHPEAREMIGGTREEIEAYAAQKRKIIAQEASELKALERLSRVQKVATEALNTPRALMSSMDLSAPLRQGLFLIHKPAFWRAWINMFQYARPREGERLFNELMESIYNHPNYRLMKEGKLAFSHLGEDLSLREEAFMSTWAEKIPIIGTGVRMSERAYTGFLNKLRADVFNQLIDAMDGVYTKNSIQDVAAFVNAATGKGNLGPLDSAAPQLNAAFFSARLIASRVKMLTVMGDPRTYVTLNPRVRREYVKSLLSVGTLALTVNTLAWMIWGDDAVEADPRSSNFGKIRIGDTRYDILGGAGQYITLAARFTSNAYKTSAGDVIEYGNEYGDQNRLTALGSFFRNKLAPVPGYAATAAAGTNPVGEEFDPWGDYFIDGHTAELFYPMIVNDTLEAIEEEGVATGLVMAAPAVFGVGVQTYEAQALDPEAELKAPERFDNSRAPEGEYEFGYVQNGEVHMNDEAREQWADELNNVTQVLMEEMLNEWPNFDDMSDDRKRELINEVRTAARSVTRERMKAELFPELYAPDGTAYEFPDEDVLPWEQEYSE